MADYQLEQDIRAQSKVPSGLVIGVDEAGRGPWAGPVTAAACWLDASHLSSLEGGLTDSKKLSHKKRAFFEKEIKEGPHLYAVADASVQEIDQLGILKATFLAMQRAVVQLASELSMPICGILVDGNLIPPFSTIGPRSSIEEVSVWPIINGDSKSLSIAAASICAKESRDRAMMQLDQTYPDYGFAAHKGYGTKQHQDALSLLGPSPAHRTSFKPVARLIKD